jgi:ribonuclease G
MSKELLINVTPSETRVALIENGVLQEVHVEREAKRGLVGNIYLGKVIRVLPGMQAAFIDINLGKAAFLHASDINSKLILNEDDNKKQVADIRSLVHEGQYIVVQVVKDPLGSKGARLTTDITVAARYLVLMPHASHAGISQRIENVEERKRLREIVTPYCNENHGFIVRTAAEGAGEQELRHDAEFLVRVWNKVLERKKGQQKQLALYNDLSLPFRVLRDFVGVSLERIRIDSKLSFDQLSQFTQELVPDLTSFLEYYPGERPIFDLFDVENEIQF